MLRPPQKLRRPASIVSTRWRKARPRAFPGVKRLRERIRFEISIPKFETARAPVARRANAQRLRLAVADCASGRQSILTIKRQSIFCDVCRKSKGGSKFTSRLHRHLDRRFASVSAPERGCKARGTMRKRLWRLREGRAPNGRKLRGPPARLIGLFSMRAVWAAIAGRTDISLAGKHGWVRSRGFRGGASPRSPRARRAGPRRRAAACRRM